MDPFLRYYPTLPRAACPDRSEPRSAWRTANWQTWSAYGRSLVSVMYTQVHTADQSRVLRCLESSPGDLLQIDRLA